MISYILVIIRRVICINCHANIKNIIFFIFFLLVFQNKCLTIYVDNKNNTLFLGDMPANLIINVF